jgi:predicted phage terminase large subunit-like protein
MGKPYIREGLLFPTDELRYYNGVLPEGDPDRIVAVCDVAFGGGDSLSMPVAYMYGDAVFIHDVVFNKGDKEVTRPVVVAKLKQHHPHMARFEANNGGDAYCEKVDEALRAENVKINMSTKRAPTTQSKLSRIIQYAPDIKQFYFIDEKHRSKEYQAFMQEVTLFVQTGKNKHDDACDSLAMLVEFMDSREKVVRVMKRPF